jgi:subtilisin
VREHRLGRPRLRHRHGDRRQHLDLRTLGNGYAAVACQSSCNTAWDDDNGHGTHVAGTIGARSNGSGVVGVAPAATLHAVKVLARDGTGLVSGVIAGIDWVATRPAPRPRTPSSPT